FKDYKKYNSASVFVTDFIDDIDSVYYSSDLIIARSGALTLSELAIVSKPAILIPSPNVAENHQLENAKAIEEKHACICIEEKDLDLIFRNKLDLVIKDKKLQEELSHNISKIALPNASNDIVELIKKHLNNDK
ncbi:MAG: glycosyltransferase, partial [Flavobacteriaceae bacterium]|nr:glycosyltransferase [Flavobacteriaceae bacterium]